MNWYLIWFIWIKRLYISNLYNFLLYIFKVINNWITTERAKSSYTLDNTDVMIGSTWNTYIIIIIPSVFRLRKFITNLRLLLIFNKFTPLLYGIEIKKLNEIFRDKNIYKINKWNYVKNKNIQNHYDRGEFWWVKAFKRSSKKQAQPDDFFLMLSEKIWMFNYKKFEFKI